MEQLCQIANSPIRQFAKSMWNFLDIERPYFSETVSDANNWRQAVDCASFANPSGRNLATMFELPIETLLLVLGAPALWIAYTIGFLWVSRHWSDKAADAEQD